MMPDLIEAMNAWARQHTGSGAIESIWANAGTAGGGGIANVNSLEELDAVMTGFPFTPFSDIEIRPMTDFFGAMGRLAEVARAAATP